MDDITSSFSAREIASTIWLSIFIAYVAMKKERRLAFVRVADAFLQRLIVVPLILATVYVTGEIVLLNRIGWWSLTNLKTTILWLLTFAFVTMFEAVTLETKKFQFRKITRDVLSFTIVLTFITELHSFPFLVELVAVPTTLFIFLLAQIAKLRPEHAIVAKPLGVLVSLIGLGYLTYGVWRTFEEWQTTATAETALEFFVPIMLSLGFLPFLYGWRLYVVYSENFLAIPLFCIEKNLIPHAKWLAITRVRGDIDLLDRWRKEIQTTRPSNKEELEHSLTSLEALKEREASPPSVEPSCGWSPYLSMQFMADYGFTTGYYKHSFDAEWCASSQVREFGQSAVMPNNVAYYVEGHEHAATRLKIKLNINDPSAVQDAESMFTIYCIHLLEQSVDASSFEQIKIRTIALEPFRADIPFGSVVMLREEFTGGIAGGYSRKFIVCRGSNVSNP